MDLITRQDALAQGLKRYYTGVPCKRGHVAEKYTSKGSCVECVSAYKQENPGKIAALAVKYRRENLPAHAARAKKWRDANHAKALEQDRAWYANNRKSRTESTRKWYSKNRERVIARSTRYARERRNNDPSFSLLDNLRARLRLALRGKNKAATTMELVGCTREELVAHIEAQFLPGMTWDDRSEWHIDHIRPCASFDLLDPGQQRACFHYTNLQPLWAADNLRKGARLD
jgi:hypothetical protein